MRDRGRSSELADDRQAASIASRASERSAAQALGRVQ